MKPIAPALIALMLCAGIASADTPPPADALPLSEIIALVEAAHDVAWIDEIDWDDDGYWEVELYLAGGGKLELRLDPLSGEVVR